MREQHLTILANRLVAVAEEMGGTLRRTAYSPNIKERRDFSCAVFDAAGELTAQAAHVPVHLGSMPAAVKSAIAAVDLAPGDAVIVNDPFAGGTHLPDITLVEAVFDATGSRLGYVANRAHHADVGGMTPGSMPRSRDIFQEGLRIPPLRLMIAGKPNDDVWDIVLANVRTPDERRGDLRAQLAANARGAMRLRDLAQVCQPSLADGCAELNAYSERLMRAALRKLPEGRYRFKDWLDDDGAGTRDIAVGVCVEVVGGKAVVTFDSTPMVAGCLNTVAAVTRSATYYVFLCLLDNPALINAGCFAPIEVHIPPASLLDSVMPHTVSAGNVETSQRIVDVVLGALAQAAPELVPAASAGTMSNLTIGGIHSRTGRPFTYYETIAGGAGASFVRDGADAVQTHMTNTLNTPVEALEYEYPFRVRRYGIVPGSGGAGRRAGGCGIRRDIELLGNAMATVVSERRIHAPYGLAGGAAGAPGENMLLRDGEKVRLAAKDDVELRPGDILSIRTPGGGGYGA